MSSSKGHLHRYNPPQPQHRPSTLSELAILKKHHQFIRDDEDNETDQQSKLSWEDKLALSWYSKLFREYAVCDLTHYKTGGVALRWRTEAEVLDRIGELTCGNLHCKYHKPVESPEDRLDDEDTRPLVPRELMPYQLNFQYQEQGKTKQALVKVVLCPKCKFKLTWKKDQEKMARGDSIEATSDTGQTNKTVDKGKGRSRALDDEEAASKEDMHAYERKRQHLESDRRRSRSPRREKERERRDERTLSIKGEAERRREERPSRISEQNIKESNPPPQRRTVVTSLMGRYYDAILAGTKTWEGRTNTPRYAALQPDDHFVFHHAEDASKPAFTCQILDVQKFDDFTDMLKNRVEMFLPGIKTLDEAVQVYENIPGYRDQVKQVGAAAFEVEVIDRGESH